MRVIAGTYRSRLLNAPRGLATRPTSDRLRETLFNVLASRIEGSVFADLYAGSGAVGIEALSRGADQVFFVEKAPAALAAIRVNLAALKIRHGFHLEARSVSAVLRRFFQIPATQFWHIVFLDPPYDDVDAYLSTLTTLGQLDTLLLAAKALVIAEHSRKHELEEQYGILRRVRFLNQGDAALSFYERAVSE
jgi:16S rRNA (guanine966-N2)-methyltransferase